MNRIARRVFLSQPFAAMAFIAAAESRTVLVHGHRGARARRPENTIPAFQYAIEHSVDVLELDVAVTRDNIPVVSHDPTLNATICTGPKPGIPIHTLTLAALEEYDCGSKRNPSFPDQTPVPGTRIPTLDQVFELGRGNIVQFNVETKIFADGPELAPDPDEFVSLILASVRKHRLIDRVILQSFDPRTLRVMKTLEPQIRRSALFESQTDWLEIAQRFDANILSPEYHLVKPDLVKQAHQKGLQVVPWTANKPQDWQRLVEAGVDAIISDDPASLIGWLYERGLHDAPG